MCEDEHWIRTVTKLRDVETVSRAFLDELFDSDDYTPRGRFVCEDVVNGKVVWVAVDNTNGEALTEEFFMRAHALKWLNGKQTVNRWGEVLNEGQKEE